MNRDHAVGCPALRDSTTDAAGCTCAPTPVSRLRGLPPLSLVGNRIVTAADVNALKNAIGCTHGTAWDGDPLAPWFWHLVEEHGRRG